MRLSKSFTFHELIRSQVASRKGIDNTPPEWAIKNLRFLAEHHLQPIRDHFNAPVIVSSGYRCEQLNKEIGGSITSGHMQGLCADYTVSGYSCYEAAKIIADMGLEFDQLILEGTWIHGGVRPPSRQQILTARFGRETTYLQGLHA